MVEVFLSRPTLHDGPTDEERLMARISRTPRVGILVECGRQGLEAVVCLRLCALLREHTGVDFEEEIVPMDNKRNLIQACGDVHGHALRFRL